jgi:bacteriocin biosynthesis cyclodehydratase domain-containing protein
MQQTDTNGDAVVCAAQGLDIVVISNDEVLIQYGTRSRPSELLRDTDLKGFVGAIMASVLRGPATVDQLIARVRQEDRGEALDFITDLIARGILTDARRDPVGQYLGYTFVGKGGLSDKTIGVIGLGPIGIRIAFSLLQHGAGKVLLLDDRAVDPTWLNFVPLVPATEKGPAQKVSAVVSDYLVACECDRAEVIAEPMNAAGLEQVVKRANLVILALEHPTISLPHLLNRLCLRNRTPWMLVAIDGNYGLVGPLFIPAKTACYNDYRTLSDAATPSPQMARKHRQFLHSRDAGPFFSGLPAYAEIVASHASLAAVHYLLRETCFAIGRVLVIDFDRMILEVEDVLKLPRCPVCGDKPLYRPLFAVETASPEKGTSDQPA